jgi:hypothetical protein
MHKVSAKSASEIGRVNRSEDKKKFYNICHTKKLINGIFCFEVLPDTMNEEN